MDNGSFQLDNSEDDDEENLATHLAQWAVYYAVPFASVNERLTILKENAWTLLKTKQTFDIQQLANGSYQYLGIQPTLIELLASDEKVSITHDLKLQINIDGLPNFKSSHQFWPILCRLANF